VGGDAYVEKKPQPATETPAPAVAPGSTGRTGRTRCAGSETRTGCGEQGLGRE